MVTKTRDKRRSELLKVLTMGWLHLQSQQSLIECENLRKIQNELTQAYTLQLMS